MNNLQTDNLIALSLLIDEDIYLLAEDKKNANYQEVTEPAITKAIEPETAKTPEIKTTEPKINITIPKLETPVKATLPAQAPNKSNKNTSFNYLGENNKYILIIVNNPDVDFINKTDLDFLVKIMGAKKWTLEDVAILNMAKYDSLDFADLKTFFACSKIVTFGFNPAILNIVGAVANQKLIYNGVAVLGTWDLPKLQKDVPKKTIFWNQLKVM
ncbi:hypothetical protein [Pedobacter alpinus]|uniref:Uncharacterized protein n=1 Tax=Pedobacter alpinus TaxID=1590643 RepID=A0ABW5TNC0_9SPHI